MHVHAMVSRGGWTQDGEWIPVAFVDEHSAELLFRHKVIRLLQDAGLLSQERTELLLSWRHTGFSVHNRVRVEAEDGAAVTGGTPNSPAAAPHGQRLAGTASRLAMR